MNEEVHKQEQPLSCNMVQALLRAADNSSDIAALAVRDALLITCIEHIDVIRITQIAGEPEFYGHLSTDRHYLIYEVEVSDEA